MMQRHLFEAPRAIDQVATDDAIEAAIRDHAWFVFNLSGGKDSTATAKAAMLHLDAAGHPRDRRIAIHADLGRAEWKSTAETVERCAVALGLPLIVVRREAGDMVARWESRFANGKARYTELRTYNLIGPWSSASLRFCTSELKAQVIGPYLARRFAGQRIVQVIGIRREESTGRKTTPISKPDERFAKPGNRAGTWMMLWHPGVDWLTEEVFDCHNRHALPLHEAYTAYGSGRLSCAFCILASIADLRAAASAAGNLDLYQHLVAMEANSTFSFQPDRWLGDVAPSLLSPGLAADLIVGKMRAAERQATEAAMPAGLRYVKGWPVREPTFDEAVQIVAARRTILAHHGLPVTYDQPYMVIDRFAELMAQKPR
jgi:3'-phosphoadenosine 5'-phosphosulfate sulfotransferase (PAPS reductase)/FAD synthetase